MSIQQAWDRVRAQLATSRKNIPVSLRHKWRELAELYKRLAEDMAGFSVRTKHLLTRIYRMRTAIVSNILVILFISLLLNVVNHFVGFRQDTHELYQWLATNYHWALTTLAVTVVAALTWDSLSPTLRTIFGDSWTRVIVWFFVGLVVVLCAGKQLPGAATAYRDGIASYLILYIVFLGIIAKIKLPRAIELRELPYIEDSPKPTNGAILYESQTRLVSDIRHMITQGQPSTFAITGPWGIGKTFLLGQARSRLIDDKTIIWLEFEPWRYASEEALIRGFYQDIGKKLAEEIPGMQYIVKPLAETTEKFVRQGDGTGIVGAALDLLHSVFNLSGDESPEKRIGSLLAREGKRLVIIVDDTERSFDGERIFRTLQLAHFAKCIKNVQVTFLCDKEVILRARPLHFGDPAQDAAQYLEKFVEREVVIPSPHPSELRQLLARFMSQRQERFGFDFQDGDITDEMLSAVGTPRAIIRLFNEYAAFRVNVGDEE